MTRRLPVAPSPGPLEEYALRFDGLFRARAQRDGFRRYLEGLLLPAERNKTLTALANTEPIAGAQRKEAQSLQWFLSESGWDEREVQERRLELLFEDPSTAPNEKGVLVIDEHGDRKWGKHTAHVGRQWLANIGKTENGVVSVSSLWANEGVYFPVTFEPYTPSHHFGGGKMDPAFRTKLKIASELVEEALGRSVPFRAVVADSFYGEDRGFKRSLEGLGVAYGRLPALPNDPAQTDDDPPPAGSAGREKKDGSKILAGNLEGGKGVAGTVRDAHTLLEGVLGSAPAKGAENAA